MGRESNWEGWFYKQNDERVGPISAMQLKELIASGLLQPRQAVWRQGSQSLLFVQAAKAVVGTVEESRQVI
jgi:hypothetical protein